MNATAQNKRYPALYLGLVLLFSGLAVPAQAVYYIDAAATGTPEDGSTWANAFRTIPTAVTKATGEFWVAQGVYTHTEAMDIKTNNILYGGFTSGMTDLSQRDWTVNRTICDGRSAGYTVLNKASDGPVTLDGFIIQNGGPAGSAGGMNVTGPGDLTVNNCVFSNNVASSRGGAIVLNDIALNAFFSNCVFFANSQYGGSDGGGAIRGHAAFNTATFWDCSFVANRTGRGSGGAINSTAGLFTLTRCTFTSNFSVASGGAINGILQLRMKDCDFIGNISTNGGGGAIYRSTANGTNFFQNCAFVGNASSNGANGGGGAICETMQASDTFLNCTFLSNTAWHATAANAPGGAIRANVAKTVLSITNCIFWGNSCSGAGQTLSASASSATLNLSYSDINTNADNFSLSPSGTKNFGPGIIDIDPQFASASYPYDVHLKSMAGRWDPALGQWVTDAVSSPCIDAGDPASDYSLEPPNNGGQINLGRYGNTVYASKSGTAARSKGALLIIR